LKEFLSRKIEPIILDIGLLPGNAAVFLQANILIINLPSKNIDGFKGLINEIEKSKVEKVLFVSSTSVYKNRNKILSESDEEDLVTGPPGRIENLFRKISKFETTIVRFGGLIGYSRNPGRFIGGGRPLHNSDSRVNLIHRDDCVNIISRIVEQGVWGEIFNCCADTHPTKREFYTRIAKNTGYFMNPVRSSGRRG
jgi:nucleoside-diphosphate-sugar epimerase